VVGRRERKVAWALGSKGNGVTWKMNFGGKSSEWAGIVKIGDHFILRVDQEQPFNPRDGRCGAHLRQPRGGRKRCARPNFSTCAQIKGLTARRFAGRLGERVAVRSNQESWASPCVRQRMLGPTNDISNQSIC
jgi:hypothetical protein